MKGKIIPLLATGLWLILASATSAQSGGDYDLRWNTIATAGYEFASGGGYELGFTVGQDTPSAFSSGGGYQILQGYWAGGGFVPTGVKLAAFWIEPRGDTLVACWESANEADNLGFNLQRSEGDEPGSFYQLNKGLIPSQVPGSPAGAYYEWFDAGTVPGQTYFYLLEMVDIQGQSTRHGPVEGHLTAAGYSNYLPLVIKGR